mmetsp:Transcript_24722/g.56869  ORF Transcript_24722/g.56869 Transcript_24722/m.56869 type:complete len:89 (+) Transcript_24722:410-676(+)
MVDFRKLYHPYVDPAQKATKTKNGLPVVSPRCSTRKQKNGPTCLISTMTPTCFISVTTFSIAAEEHRLVVSANESMCGQTVAIESVSS